MAQYHAHGSISHNACLTFAYDCRDEIIDPNTGKKANYRYKEDLLYSNSFMAEFAPQAWTENPALCWQAVAENEGEITANGKQAQHARKVEFALPKELSQEKAIEACDEFAKSMQEKGMCVSYGLHKTSSGNIHCHCMMTLRKLDKNGKWEKNKFKSQYVYEQKKDENGKPIFDEKKQPIYVLDDKGKPKKIPQLDENGQQKFRERPGKGREMLWVREVVDVNEWNNNEWYKTNVREKIETICNDKLKEIGSTERVDCRSYKERGIHKIPTIHEGCYSDTAVRQLFNKQIRERNQKEESWEQLAAELKERIAAEAVKVTEPIIDIPAAAADQTQELRPASESAVNSGEPILQTATSTTVSTTVEIKDRALTTDIEDNSIAESQSAPPVNTVADFSESVNPAVSPAQPEAKAAAEKNRSDTDQSKVASLIEKQQPHAYFELVCYKYPDGTLEILEKNSKEIFFEKIPENCEERRGQNILCREYFDKEVDYHKRLEKFRQIYKLEVWTETYDMSHMCLPPSEYKQIKYQRENADVDLYVEGKLPENIDSEKKHFEYYGSIKQLQDRIDEIEDFNKIEDQYNDLVYEEDQLIRKTGARIAGKEGWYRGTVEDVTVLGFSTRSLDKTLLVRHSFLNFTEEDQNKILKMQPDEKLTISYQEEKASVLVSKLKKVQSQER